MKSLMLKADSFVTSYDRRLLILALIYVFKEKLKQQQLDETAMNCLECAILQLHVQRMEEERKLAPETSTTNHTKGKSGTGSKREPLNDIERQDIAVYNLVKGKTYNLCEVLMDDDEDSKQNDEILDFLVSASRTAQRSIQYLISPVKDVDEFSEFSSMFAEMKGFFQEKVYPLIVEKLSSSARLVLPGILQCKKVSTITNEKQNDVEIMPRKIVKVKTKPKAPTMQE